MHYLIGIAVRARDQDEAIDEAKDFFKSNLLNQYGIDYGSIYSDVAGAYSDVAELNAIDCTATPLSSPNSEGQYIGRDFADYLVETTENIFRENINKIREFLATKSDDDLWDDGASMDRYNLHEAGAYGGGSIRLYDAKWGGGIRSQWDYDKVKENWSPWNTFEDTEDQNDIPYWIVPMDIHI